MRAIGNVMMVVICLLIGGSAWGGDEERFQRVLLHVDSALQEGDLPIAKLLIDAAVTDADRYTSSQQEILVEIRDGIYGEYIVKRLEIITEQILVEHDGYAALDGIDRITDMANVADIELKHLEGLTAAALLTAAFQNLGAASRAERDGDLERSDKLREAAESLLSDACELDPRVMRILEKMQATDLQQ